MGYGQRTLEHHKRHVQYPATKKDLVMACSDEEFDKADMDWYSKVLPEKTYSSPKEVYAALLDAV